jgi:hypothetical protein
MIAGKNQLGWGKWMAEQRWVYGKKCCSAVSLFSLPVFAVLNVEKVQHAGSLVLSADMLKRHTTLGRIPMRSEDSHA